MSLRGVYEHNAVQFDRDRTRDLHERGWLERFCAEMPRGGRVLDLGCGAGEPMAGYLIGRGLAVTGVDFAPAMLELARARFPDGRWIEGDMRALDLGEVFDGVLAWNSFFHLTAEEQRGVIPRLAAHLCPGGALMMSVGPEAGDVWGTVAGEAVYHASLSPDDYAAELANCGCEVAAFCAEDADCNGHSVLLARKG
ncbi:class I SAM-dependent methyltransferase [Rhodobacteraceae bacterium D3-12]|nr:class I SAM-dependent methyltransferase [Rhodobacteraceae bacterium D3-12]